MSDVRNTQSCDRWGVAEHKCGWPYHVPKSSAIVYCNLDLGHDGPWCKLVTMDGEAVVVAPRFGVADLTATEE